MRIRPLHDNVILRRLESPQVSKGGIIIPDQAKERPVEGKVIAVGPGRRSDQGILSPMGVQEGDVVTFSKYSGSEVQFDGESAVVITEREIIGVVVE